MRWLRRRPASPPAATPGPIDGWKITTTLRTGESVWIDGPIPSHIDQGEALRYIDAIAAGLRAAGFDVDVELERTERVRR